MKLRFTSALAVAEGGATGSLLPRHDFTVALMGLPPTPSALLLKLTPTTGSWKKLLADDEDMDGNTAAAAAAAAADDDDDDTPADI